MLAEDMGLGKSLQTLMVIAGAAMNNERRHLAVLGDGDHTHPYLLFVLSPSSDNGSSLSTSTSKAKPTVLSSTRLLHVVSNEINSADVDELAEKTDEGPFIDIAGFVGETETSIKPQSFMAGFNASFSVGDLQPTEP